jgi:hypothetical protein
MKKTLLALSAVALFACDYVPECPGNTVYDHGSRVCRCPAGTEYRPSSQMCVEPRPPVDGGGPVDSGTPEEDAGTMEDAGSGDDAGGDDAGTDAG